MIDSSHIAKQIIVWFFTFNDRYAKVMFENENDRK